MYYLRNAVSWPCTSWKSRASDKVFVSRSSNSAGLWHLLLLPTGYDLWPLLQRLPGQCSAYQLALPRISVWSFSSQTSTLFLDSVLENIILLDISHLHLIINISLHVLRAEFKALITGRSGGLQWPSKVSLSEGKKILRLEGTIGIEWNEIKLKIQYTDTSCSMKLMSQLYTLNPRDSLSVYIIYISFVGHNLKFCNV